MLFWLYSIQITEYLELYNISIDVVLIDGFLGPTGHCGVNDDFACMVDNNAFKSVKPLKSEAWKGIASWKVKLQKVKLQKVEP